MIEERANPDTARIHALIAQENAASYHRHIETSPKPATVNGHTHLIFCQRRRALWAERARMWLGCEE